MKFLIGVGGYAIGCLLGFMALTIKMPEVVAGRMPYWGAFCALLSCGFIFLCGILIAMMVKDRMKALNDKK